MKPRVIGIGGGTGSGKSSLRRALAKRLDASHGSFGATVRERARLEGLPREREILADLGQRWLIADIDGFCRAVVDASGWCGEGWLVLDGFRHLEAVEQVRQIATPTPFYLVWLDAELSLRARRLRQRGDAETEGSLPSGDQHATEAQVHDGSLAAIADLNLDAESSVDDMVRTTLAALADADRRSGTT